jgi:endonuclease YncB( thermonuclease family)
VSKYSRRNAVFVIFCLALFLGLLLLEKPHAAQLHINQPREREIAGYPSIIDADTIEIGGKRIRLYGIDAPEARQTCVLGGKSWLCGRTSTEALRQFLLSDMATCQVKDIDRYSRFVALCRVRETDISKWLVGEGLAVAYARYSRDYVPDETAARIARKGIWQSEFDMPWDWRRNKRTRH